MIHQWREVTNFSLRRSFGITRKDVPLAPYRMLDLTNERGFLCGKIFADLGADVIKIEPPGGDCARDIGPFYKDIPDREKSLFWFAFNTGKKSIKINIETDDGQQILRRLVKTADFLIESFDPGYLDELNISYALHQHRGFQPIEVL